MKKIALLVLMVFATMAFANPFSDVKQNHWAYDAVNQLAAKGIITGYPDGTFKGNKAVTRYDMAVIIARLLEKLNTTPGIKAKMGKGDLDSVQKLVVEFTDELSLLGVKVSALEDEMSAVKDDLAVIKEDVKTLKAGGGQGGKIKITGDMQARFVDYSYSDSVADRDMNENFFRDRLGLNLDMVIDPDVTACLRLEKYSYWNTCAGDWTSVGGGAGVGVNFNADTNFRTYLSYIQVKDFFGWTDQMKVGRQRFTMGHDLLVRGVADGISFVNTVDKKRNIVARTGALKMDDADSGTLGVARNDNEGLDLFYTDWTFDLKDVMAELYLINGRDALSSTGVGLFDAGTPWMHVHRDTWYGLALSGNPVPELTLWGEYSWLKWDQDVNVDNLGGTEDGDSGYLLGLNWDINKKTAFKLQYTKFNEWFFRPMASNQRTVWDIATYLDPSDAYLYDAAGYRAGFADTMAELSYNISEKSTLTGRYEKITDDMTYGANAPADDRDVLTGVLKYQYKPNTALRLTYRSITCAENETATVAGTQVATGSANPLAGVHGAAGDGYGNVVGTAAKDGANKKALLVDDVTMLRLQMDVNF